VLSIFREAIFRRGRVSGFALRLTFLLFANIAVFLRRSRLRFLCVSCNG
jgi:hypothetical protein